MKKILSGYPRDLTAVARFVLYIYTNTYNVINRNWGRLLNET